VGYRKENLIPDTGHGIPDKKWNDKGDFFHYLSGI
jgi:hypothetical protein